jgi:Na+-driven multidrug efflux pump
VRGFLQGSFRTRDLLKPPSRQLVQEFSPYILPVTSTQVGRVSGYVAMAHVVSSSLGTVSMAAQQVIVSLFYCLCPMADSLSLTAQSFVPAIHEKAPSKQRTQALRKTIVNFVKAGVIFGCIMTSAVACIPLLSRFFTTDRVVISMVNQVVPLLLAFFSVHGILCAAEGLLLGASASEYKGLACFSALYSLNHFFSSCALPLLIVSFSLILQDKKISDS